MPTSTANGGMITKPRPTNHKVKSFEVAARATIPAADLTPLPFVMRWHEEDGTEHLSPQCTLDGCTETEPHSWHARPWMISDIDLMQIPNMEVSQDSVALWRTFQSALGDDYGDFDRWIHLPEVFVDAETILPILGWLVEEATGRPTVPS